MNTCDTCRFWRLEDWLEPSTEGTIGMCDSPMVFRPTYGPERSNQRHTDKFTPDRVYTCDEGGCTGELMTGPKFGCIHHSPAIASGATP